MHFPFIKCLLLLLFLGEAGQNVIVVAAAACVHEFVVAAAIGHQVVGHILKTISRSLHNVNLILKITIIVEVPIGNRLLWLLERYRNY